MPLFLLVPSIKSKTKYKAKLPQPSVEAGTNCIVQRSKVTSTIFNAMPTPWLYIPNYRTRALKQ